VSGASKNSVEIGRIPFKVARARGMFSQLVIGKMGHSGAELARYPGVTTSSVNR
jgi:hypothetical protein